MSKIKKFLMVIVIAFFILALFCFYTVKEGQRALILHLGSLIVDENNQPLIIKPLSNWSAP